MLIDTHCHLDFLDFDTDRDDVLLRARAAGVDFIINVGSSLKGSQQAVLLAAHYPNVFASIGIHPHDARQDIGPILELAREKHAKLVGIGECGLDYYYEHSPRDDQRRAFAEQIALAHELDLALVVHARDAFDDLTDILTSEGVPERTVIHCLRP